MSNVNADATQLLTILKNYADLHFFYRNYKKFCEDEISAIGNWME